MKINSKVKYGLRTLIELGMHDNNSGVFQKDIAKNQQISQKYLDPIIAALKISGLIVNIGGKKSGYILKKPPSEITIFDVYTTFEPTPAIINCLACPSVCNRENICSVKDYWSELNDVIIRYLKDTTLDTIIEREKELNLFVKYEKEKVKKS